MSIPIPPRVIQPIRVFLASPSDVPDERKAVRRIVDELNRSLQAHGWRVELLGWEDRGPTGGRAQADINQDVEICDVFAGVLWRSWGTPTGEASSGFAEEWSLASGRFEETGSPDLWLYFKEPGKDVPETEQLAKVRAFRDEVQSAEAAFYKLFTGLTSFERLFRERLLDHVLQHTALTRSQIGVLAIDWSTAYRTEPVSLLADGADRLDLAKGLRESDPTRAAELLSELAAEIDKLGFLRRAGGLRMQAARALLAADEPERAVGALRHVLGRFVWWLMLDDLQSVLNELGEVWPPELASELRAWRACRDILREPAGAASRLEAALGLQHAFVVDPDTDVIWRSTLWRCWLHLGTPQRVLNDPTQLPALTDDLKIELNFLHAEALRAVGGTEADEAWKSLRMAGLERGQSDPGTSAWVATRCARDKIAAELMDEAEEAYLDAASRWTRAGRNEQAAMSFFSAQVTGRMADALSFTGWAWREAAASQRETARSFTSRARELETEALGIRSEHREAVLPQLLGALWLQQRAGLFQGEQKVRAFAADENARQGNMLDAVRLYCLTRDDKRAKAEAQQASDPKAIVDMLLGPWPTWTRETRCAVLGVIGSCASDEAAAELLPMVLDSLTPSDDISDSTHRTASDALAQLALVSDDDTLADRLLALAGQQDLNLAEAGRRGLRMLADLGRTIDLDGLIDCFATNGHPQEPPPAWVAERLTTPRRIAAVRDGLSTVNNSLRALTALAIADVPAHDPGLRAHFRRSTEKMLASDLGMTEDGSAMQGLIAFQGQGLFAAATADPELMAAAADRFLGYALSTKWPMNNRVQAVLGLWPLIKPGDDGWLELLRPLASPETDLDDDSSERWAMWAARGDLEAAAIRVCSAFEFSPDPPRWLDEVVRSAAFDDRRPVRETAWFAAARRKEWFNNDAARYALLDEPSTTRAAVLHAWHTQSELPLPSEVALRLLDGDVRTRLVLLNLIKAQSDELIASRLRDDPDAYVRGAARHVLGG